MMFTVNKELTKKKVNEKHNPILSVWNFFGVLLTTIIQHEEFFCCSEERGLRCNGADPTWLLFMNRKRKVVQENDYS